MFTASSFSDLSQLSLITVLSVPVHFSLSGGLLASCTVDGRLYWYSTFLSCVVQLFYDVSFMASCLTRTSNSVEAGLCIMVLYSERKFVCAWPVSGRIPGSRQMARIAVKSGRVYN